MLTAPPARESVELVDSKWRTWLVHEAITEGEINYFDSSGSRRASPGKFWRELHFRPLVCEMWAITPEIEYIGDSSDAHTATVARSRFYRRSITEAI